MCGDPPEPPRPGCEAGGSFLRGIATKNTKRHKKPKEKTSPDGYLYSVFLFVTFRVFCGYFSSPAQAGRPSLRQVQVERADRIGWAVEDIHQGRIDQDCSAKLVDPRAFMDVAKDHQTQPG
jgi:hypothetical protein